MSALTLTAHYRRVLATVADGSCLVALSGTLMNLRDYGALVFDCHAQPIPWRVTLLGYETLAVGDVAEEP